MDEEETIMSHLERLAYGGNNSIRILRIDDKEPNMMYVNRILDG